MSHSLWPMDCSMPSLPVHHHLPEFAQVQVHCIDDAIQPSHPLTPSSPSALNLSQHQGLFQWAPVCIRWTEYWSFNFSTSPSNKYSGLISLKIDWFDLLAVQRTLRSLLQHYSLKASTLGHSTFFTVQFSQTHMTTGKTIVLTIQTFVGRVMSLLFNTLSRFLIAFLPRSKCLALCNSKVCSMPGFRVLHYLPSVCSNSFPLSWWCYLAMSSSAAFFSFCLQSFPVSGSFLMSWLFTSSGQSIGLDPNISFYP